MSVEEEAPGVVSVICKGRHLDRLPVSGGQFLQWRFLVSGMWWQAHPYSLSAMPTANRIRITVKSLGDHSGSLAELEPGTPVAIEGPYGAFTKHVRKSDRILLVGAGVGATPIRALLDDLPRHVDTTVILRGRQQHELVLRDEIAQVVGERAGRLHEVVGPREQAPLDVQSSAAARARRRRARRVRLRPGRLHDQLHLRRAPGRRAGGPDPLRGLLVLMDETPAQPEGRAR